MAGLYGLTRTAGAYLADNGVTYRLSLTVDDFNAGGFTAPSGTLSPLPRAWRPRIVYGVSSTGIRTKTPVATPSTALWVGGAGGTFTKGPASTSFTVEGCRGEKRFVHS